MLPSLFWKLLHQLRRKMEFAGSTGTLKQAPKAILQSCSTFPSVQVSTAAPSEHTPTCVQGRKRGKEVPAAAPHIWIVSVKQKLYFCSLMSQMLGMATICQGQGQMLQGLLARAAQVSHLSCPSPTPGTHSTALSDCTVCRHRKGRGTGEVGLMGNKGKCAALLIRNTSTK